MMELATSAMMLISMFYGTNYSGGNDISPQSANRNNEVVMNDSNFADDKALMAPVSGSVAVEDEVRNYYIKTPILAEIARCESGFRHIGENGEIIRGVVNKNDIGVMQINTFYHQEIATKLGIDLKTLRGNMAFAKWLYEKEGTTPWQSSSGCWEKYTAISRK